MKHKNLTPYDYAKFMPLGLRIRYIRNIVSMKSTSELFIRHPDFKEAINKTMHWTSTPEGHTFWNIIHDYGMKEAYKKFPEYFKKP